MVPIHPIMPNSPGSNPSSDAGRAGGRPAPAPAPMFIQMPVDRQTTDAQLQEPVDQRSELADSHTGAQQVMPNLNSPSSTTPSTPSLQTSIESSLASSSAPMQSIVQQPGSSSTRTLLIRARSSSAPAATSMEQTPNSAPGTADAIADDTRTTKRRRVVKYAKFFDQVGNRFVCHLCEGVFSNLPSCSHQPSLTHCGA